MERPLTIPRTIRTRKCGMRSSQRRASPKNGMPHSRLISWFRSNVTRTGYPDRRSPGGGGICIVIVGLPPSLGRAGDQPSQRRREPRLPIGPSVRADRLARQPSPRRLDGDGSSWLAGRRSGAPRMSASFELRLAPADEARLAAVIEHARRDDWARRLMDRDPSLWTDDPIVQAAIADRLGWLDAPAHFTDQIAALEGFGDGIRVAGFRTAVVMGMGGSSLAPEVLHRTFGTAEGYLDLRVLDSTDPEAVDALLDDLDPLSTLWIVASKSGTTTEPLAFLADAWARIDAALEAAMSDQQPGEFVVAITDPGRSVAAIPHHDQLREVFLNPPDIGGRYSALSYVGLVPASLIGLDLDALLTSASTMLAACREPNPDQNPGLRLGLALGELARAGRDKLTFIADPTLAGFGAWAEQLVAESTGKHGVGIVPVDGEPLGDPGAYGTDRVFVGIGLAGQPDPSRGRMDALGTAGHPVIRIILDDPMDIGAEFVRWEVATAIAGAVLGIDPFDQPNVEDAKARTRNVLAAEAVGVVEGTDVAARAAEEAGPEVIWIEELGEDALVDAIRASIRGAKPGRYVAIQAFIAPTTERDAAFRRLRALVRDRTGWATTVGYGPRFLHSTGQLHKGGAPIGWFLQLTAEHTQDLQITGWPYTFGRLIDAQAQGDAEALHAAGLPVLRLRLGRDAAADLATLERAFARALGG
ncbi:MAG: glucose-6-phosphate isomerase [Chloroflexota bacterium]|nr:MAG: glucose-6-phosphate isomerase [Chloroflexota bacterium]